MAGVGDPGFPDSVLRALRAAAEGDRSVRAEAAPGDGPAAVEVVDAVNALLERLDTGADGAATFGTEELATTQRFLEAAPNAMIVVDPRGRIVLVNRRVETLFGYTREELLGATVDRLVPDDVRARHEGLRDSFYAHPGTRPMGAGRDLHGRRKDGAEIPVEIGLNPVETPSGMFVVASVIDISERKRNERDREAKVLAEEAAKAKSAFLARMSHEIRTPMNAVIGLTGLLLESELDGEQRDFVETIQSSSEHLLMIINDILDFSKIDAGELTIEPVPFEVASLVSSAADLIGQAARQKGLGLSVDVAADVPARVVGDAGRIRQVLLNLLSNALKFTDAGRIDVRVGAFPPTDDGIRLRFAVSDTGSGIPADRLRDIFDEFAQVDASDSRVHGGTGLGLAICRRLVEAMGGTITVDSEIGEGSEFVFTILTGAAPDAGGPAPDERRGRRVLLVYSADTRDVVAFVTSTGGLVRATEDVSQALRWMAGGERFDVVIIDDAVGDAEGLGFAAVVRSRRPDLPVVVLTSSEAAGDRAGRDGLAEAVVAKPVDRSRLMDAVTEAIHAASERPLSRDVRILVVEDNPVNQKVAVSILRKRGYAADVAGDGIEALEMLALGPYDVVFMDVQMPRLDGLETTRRIRSAGGDGPAPWIVGLTAHALPEDREACLAAGMDDYFVKPITSDKLVEALARAGRGRIVASATASDEDPVNREKLDSLRRAVGADRFSGLVEEFISDAARLAASIGAAVGGGDAPAVRKAAHMLRSTSAMLGAERLADACSALERRASTGDLAALAEDAARVRELVDRLDATLHDAAARPAEP